MARQGLLSGIVKLLLYGVATFLVISFVYPTMLEDPAMVFDQVSAVQRAVDTGTTVDVDSIDPGTLERRIHHYVNQRRGTHGLDQLSFDARLAAIARAYSTDMAERGFFSHYSPEGESFQDRYDEAGYDCRVREGNSIYTGGENLARSYIGRPVMVNGQRETYTTVDGLAESIVVGWMNSPEHRENMLHPVWNREGIGVHLMEDGTVHATQNFC